MPEVPRRPVEEPHALAHRLLSAHVVGLGAEEGRLRDVLQGGTGDDLLLWYNTSSLLVNGGNHVPRAVLNILARLHDAGPILVALNIESLVVQGSLRISRNLLMQELVRASRVERALRCRYLLLLSLRSLSFATHDLHLGTHVHSGDHLEGDKMQLVRRRWRSQRACIQLRRRKVERLERRWRLVVLLVIRMRGSRRRDGRMGEEIRYE